MLSDQQKQLIETRIHDVREAIESHFDLSLPQLDVQFNIRGTAWGYYRRKEGICSVHFNAALCAEHFEETLSDVIPHELAHFAVDQMYRTRRKPHGVEWRRIMKTLGIENPSVRHHKDVSHLAVKRQRRHAYECSCQQHWLSTTRHNRIIKGVQKYVCKRCGTALIETRNTSI